VLDRRAEGNSLLNQAFKLLHFVDPNRLKHKNRAWDVKLVAEGAADQGGPFVESLTTFAVDIQNELLVPCPNQREGVGYNQDKFVPKRAANRPLNDEERERWRFVGKLIGVAIRTHQTIDLRLPGFFWKALVGQSLDVSDIAQIDNTFAQLLGSLSSDSDAKGLNQSNFELLVFEYFTVRSAGDPNSTLELVTNGKARRVTWPSRGEWAQLAEQVRLHEFDDVLNMVRLGLGEIVSIAQLSIWSWMELERLVCGVAFLDVAHLRARTRYGEGVTETTPIIRDFWTALSSFSQEQQELFLKFVCGRSRLPASGEFDMPFVVEILDADIRTPIDTWLPTARTCFFTLLLPRYSSLAVLQDRLVYAITVCADLDADFNARNQTPAGDAAFLEESASEQL